MKDLEKKEDIEILKNNYLGHLVYISNGRPRVKPITYYYDQTHNSIICYSAEDHKISAMRKNNRISLEVEEIESTDNWRSVIVNGEFEELHGSDAKYLLHQFTLGVKHIVNRKEKKDLHFIKEFSSKLSSDRIPVVYRINVLEITGKQREPERDHKSWAHNEKVLRTDTEIKKEILESLKWDPDIDDAQIGVIVENGTVTLTGFVDDFQKRVAAERLVKKTRGVKALAADIDVKYGDNYRKTDQEIAKALVRAFEWDTSVPQDKINIEVRAGWVDLSGEVEHHYERNAAKRVAENIMGVKGINTIIKIKQILEPSKISEEIKNAYMRIANIEASNIAIKVNDGLVTLSGKANTISEKEDAEKAAYNALGVTNVINEIEVVEHTKYNSDYTFTD